MFPGEILNIWEEIIDMCVSEATVWGKQSLGFNKSQMLQSSNSVKFNLKWTIQLETWTFG